MSLYTIGDLHLSLGGDKPMDVFGGRWTNYVEKIRDGFSSLNAEDVTVICGDISWAIDINGAREDFLFIDALPGKKIILKGNHDYWWTTASKAYNFFNENGISTISILHNNCFFYGETAICGTRGWFYEEEKSVLHDKKILNRELMRLEKSLKDAGDHEKLVFLHYPPKYGNYECTEILDMLEKYGVKHCYYGHLHAGACAYAFKGVYRGVEFKLVSADNVFFIPQKIL